jgi:uroporphyrin-III C-methyltransferase
MKKYSNPKLTLVGAGPGDPELITIKALNALASADVVLYDALANPALLKHAPRNAVKHFVGKRCGVHRTPQDEINRLIVDYAFSHGHVVRLKGGDPFVFGRGQEEIEYAELFSIKATVVPGISSSLSLPALQKIPLTKRGINESFWVLTGTTRTLEVSKDITLAAQSSATIIILMGMGKLKEIIRIFKHYGKAETPIAIIQNGSLPNEKVGIGTIRSIKRIVKTQGLGSPAVIIIGEVVNEHPSLKSLKVSLSKQLNVESYAR